MLDSSLYDDYESSLPLESNVFDDAPLIDLEDVFDPPLASLPLFTLSLSNTSMATSISDLTFLASPLPSPQCTGLEMGETSRVDVMF